MQQRWTRYLRAFAEIAVLGFVGTLNAVVNTWAVARYLGGNVVLSQPAGRAAGCLDHEERERG